MKKKRTGIDVLRIAVEIISLALVILLVKNHKLQMWFAVFALSALGALFLGRYYCCWICPMNTAFRIINFIYAKLYISRLQTPKALRSRVPRIIILIVFIASMLITRLLNYKLNMLLYIILFSILLTLIFEEEFWHRRLCPFGTILSLTSGRAHYAMIINEDECISCGKCQECCPSSSIQTLENNKRRNMKRECLLCGKCVDICPVSVCNFTFKQ